MLAAGGANTRQQSELSMAASGNNIAIAFNDFSNNAAASVVASNDGGQTFSARTQPPPPAGSGPSGDSALVADSNGNFYFTTIYETDGASPTAHCTNSTHVSTDGGKTFGGIAGSPFSYNVNTANFPDQPHPAIDRVNRVNGNPQIYMSTRHFTSGITCGGTHGTGSVQTEVACSTNGATSWSTPVVLGGVDLAHLAAGADGSVYAVGMNGGAVNIRRSTNSCNGGLSFGSATNVATGLTFSSVGLDRGDSQAYAAVDKTNSNVVYVTYSADAAANTNRDVFLARCTFTGTTGACATPIRVNDNADPAGKPTSQYFPMLCVDPNNNILLSWNDRRNDSANNLQTAIYAAQTTLSGTTLNVGANFRIDDASFAPFDFGGAPDYGDYNENNDACDAKHFYIAWSSQVSPSYITPASNDVDVFFAVAGKFATTTAVASTPNPSVLNQSVTFTATVSGVAPATGTPTGTVTFLDGATTLGTGTLSGSPAKATFATSNLSLGTHSITATYGGDANFNPSTSPPLIQTVNKRPTSLAYNGSKTSDFNDPTTVSATLTDVTTASPLAGKSVSFTLNGVDSCTGTTNAAGLAACQLTPSQAAGTYPLTAAFAGDSTYLGSTTQVDFVVTREETTLTYTGPTKIANGQPFAFTALLREDGVTPIPGRQVVIRIGSGPTQQSCIGTTDAFGVASCTMTPNQPLNVAGTVPLTAEFTGDPYYLPSSTTATLTLQFMTGRAFGISARANVLNLVKGLLSPTPDTGSVRTPFVSMTSTPCVATATASGVLSINAQTLCANVTTTLNPGASSANATVARATIGIPGVPLITVTGVSASSYQSCAMWLPSTTITKLTIGGAVIDVSNIPPNTKISAGPATITLNEQTRTSGPDFLQGVVNAVHITDNDLLAQADIVLASATADIHNCL